MIMIHDKCGWAEIGAVMEPSKLIILDPLLEIDHFETHTHTHTHAHILKDNYNKQLNSEALNVFIVQQALLGDAVPTTSATKALLLAYGKNRKPATKHDVLVHGITALSTVSILSSSLPDSRDPETLRDLQSLDEGSEHNARHTDIIIYYHIYYHIYIIIYIIIICT